jgi:hypothetical protein
VTIDEAPAANIAVLGEMEYQVPVALFVELKTPVQVMA